MLNPKVRKIMNRVVVFALIPVGVCAVGGWMFFNYVWYGPYSYLDFHRMVRTDFVYPGSKILDDSNQAVPVFLNQIFEPHESEILQIELPKGTTYETYVSYVSQQTKDSPLYIEGPSGHQSLADFIKQNPDSVSNYSSFTLETQAIGASIDAGNGDIAGPEDAALRDHLKAHIVKQAASPENTIAWFEGPHGGIVVNVDVDVSPGPVPSLESMLPKS